MGNEKSSYSETKIEETFEENENWTYGLSTLPDGTTKICVFQQRLENKLKAQKLQNLSKNLKLHRHPHIPRFVSSWQSNGILFLATEPIKPLRQVLKDFLPMQLCIGLRSILEAVIFLHETATMSHNNISLDAIYVNSEGCWKLGGLESMTSLQPTLLINDQRDFAEMALRILSEVENDDIPAVEEFKNHCAHQSSEARFFPNLSSHSFFDHEFVNIHTFLTELPIKCEEEKSLFFKTLAENLATFPELLVARQLGTLLLSRLVLLNEVAQTYLLPKIFKPRSDHYESLFSYDVLKQYVQPKLLHMFGLRDSQIRLILLRYFSSVCSIFTKQQLESRILPELLVGVKDTNEQLVVATLRALADLVPLLGASVVIGQHQTKLFADGRPLKNVSNTDAQLINTVKEVPAVNAYTVLTERQSPDGGEDSKQLSNATNEKTEAMCGDSEITVDNSTDNCIIELPSSLPKQLNPVPYLENNDYLNSLDVKYCRTKNGDLPIDDIELMFKDMEPIISRPTIFDVRDPSLVHRSKFEPVDVDLENGEGWDEDVTDLISSEELL